MPYHFINFVFEDSGVKVIAYIGAMSYRRKVFSQIFKEWGEP